MADSGPSELVIAFVGSAAGIVGALAAVLQVRAMRMMASTAKPEAIDERIVRLYGLLRFVMLVIAVMLTGWVVDVIVNGKSTNAGFILFAAAAAFGTRLAQDVYKLTRLMWVDEPIRASAYHHVTVVLVAFLSFTTPVMFFVLLQRSILS